MKTYTQRTAQWLLLILTGIISLFGASIIYVQSFAVFSRYLIYISLGIVVMLGVMTRDCRKISRYYAVMLVGMLLLLLLCVYKGESMNGARRWLNVFGFALDVSDLSMLNILPISCLLYHCKNGGWKAIHELFWVCFIFFILLLQLPSLSNAFILASCTVGILLMAILRKHLNEDKPSGEFLIPLAAGSIAFAGMLTYFIKASPYLSQRIEVFFSRGTLDPYGHGYQLMTAAKWLSLAHFLGPAQNTSMPINLSLPHSEDGFILVNLIAHFGWLAGIVLLLLIIGFITQLFRMTYKLQDPCGYFVAFSASLMLSLRFLFGVLMNFNLWPVAGWSIPLLSYAPTAMITNMALIGVVLSVSRSDSFQTKEQAHDQE
ncbi:MAG: FtsW/RodA/SpoVE family cell cycle protein [Synergistaceae bacterium]|jgi:cell division protein FtsW|nr:FtsW/RodA/SpoVE family cell cycle protein [Synergistaceae bacterium]